jgi:hypothetical protein
MHAAALTGLLLQSGCVRGGQPDVAAPRVRSGSPLIRDLVREGQDRSATFRRTIQRVNGSDGIVYIEPGGCPLASTPGCLLHWIGDAGQFRVLRILLKLEPGSRDRLIAVIAHELQHANEVLTSDARTTAAVRSLFWHRGSSRDPRAGETPEAVRIGELVAEELNHAPALITSAR